MEIDVKVITRAKMNVVEKLKNVYIVRTTAVPDFGKANVAIQKLLAKYFSVGKSKIKILKGGKCRMKKIKIEK